jgi:hypothetical protein
VQLVPQLGDVTFEGGQRYFELLHDVYSRHGPATAEQTLVLVKAIDFGHIGTGFYFLPV